MNVGIEWIVDAEGCPASLLRDLNAMQAVCDRIVSDLGLRVLGKPAWHRFEDPGGVTGIFLLTESHLACHTYPEVGIATFNLYCCRPRPEWPWQEMLIAFLGATNVKVRVMSRGSEQSEQFDTVAASQEACNQ